ncbi:helix-turn-helix domain-containing protein [Actinospica sp. MGRD01-02]|uniref:Helix-turn-helix domain-containing protein n=1 Tax=Actinospica acidithermotolerans TaxID=2828514 RepID=A0A941EAT6_9ACTN|nr:helix-turn-helix domain-containing protein [Actinospica acidithermotolerans]
MVKARRTGLTRRRRAVGLSQQDLADRLRVDVRSVGRWDAGTGEPQPWLRVSLARALEITAVELEVLLCGDHTAALDQAPAQAIGRSADAAGAWAQRDRRVGCRPGTDRSSPCPR